MSEKLDDKENPTWYKKVFYENKYYYCFRDVKRTFKEEHDFMSSKKFSKERYDKM
ncbi:hypothetical protein MmmBen181_0440 [Mycoplasma mycoides subsp. mycoides]|uniref:Uncharacterized protein n=1 Tax=Mycoplasma mycoides subsp. mycoides TaxID=2103 RepID=A0AAE2EID8_MYCMY|nr:conserved domain protein [Mycoplasma mycoides subsp. mycoides SC str. Gladysdale]AIZ55249.1 hypothetical protein mycmycITA_00422 [Mycoplasma mycoides subsp. mycoides]AME10595.1 hypothetical protein MmmBen_0423 [Mycoplasma mycoides subsp. mycoides]AME11602.1 hypothetical protein MmmBen50_0415 [Mycoplasma mycoides subsp. mycoides]AME12630.1 hypothetical protein MmmBen181_0440 [Mycoplasma mycoides subsp. mycoides]